MYYKLIKGNMNCELYISISLFIIIFDNGNKFIVYGNKFIVYSQSLVSFDLIFPPFYFL